MLIVDAVLAPIAAGMAVVTAYLVKWSAEARTPLRAGVVLFLLLMMAAMLGGAAIYYARPSAASAVEGLWTASALMSVSVFAVFLPFLSEARLRLADDKAPAPPLAHPRAFVAAVVLLVLGNELLMGWTFRAAAGGPGPGPAGLAILAASVNSPWFLFTMAAEMALTAFFVRDRLPRGVLPLLLGQSGIMALSPTALALGAWANDALYAGCVVMIGWFVYLMEFLYREKELSAGLSAYLLLVLAVYAVMMAGLYVWLVDGSGVLFAIAVALEMVLFLEIVVRPESASAGPRVPWQLRPHWTFGLLALIFGAELFMGAVLNLALLGPSFTALLPALPLAGPPAVVLYNAVYNGFWFLGLTTGSTWFLAMMGAEMGALVVFKYRETRSRETRVRLLLMMTCYGAFAVFFPSLYYAEVFPGWAAGASVPVLGWSMGIGSAPLAVSVFGVLILSYLIVGGLSVLFGRRVVCSTFCTAPLMYQGTTVDAMKSFNHSSPLARKFLSSRFSSAYTAITGVVLVALFAGSAVSYLDQTGALAVTILGADPTVFLFALSFSVLWYVLFVTIPYAGNYNCVTIGWCYTGQIAAAFGRLGFFKLKVRDKEVCRRCTTLDCAKACPIGLVDMPGHFRQTGEFRSAKCCGVGNCVEVCPYGNLYFHDIRHWVRRRLGRPDVPPISSRLPMVSTRPSAARLTPASSSTSGAAPSGSALRAPRAGGAPPSVPAGVTD